jgi:hypothetical protein
VVFSAVVVSAMVSSVVVSRFFLMCFGGWEIFLMCFRGWAVFSVVLWCFFSAFDGSCFAAIVFFYFFGGDSGLMSIS